jgi:hypothetical protein
MTESLTSARWHFQRKASPENGAVLSIHTGAGELLVLPMTEEEAWELVRQADRVMSFSAGAAQGSFSPKPTPAQAAGQLAIERYLVTSQSLDIHTNMALAAPWANWVEAVPAAKNFAYLVTVFAADAEEFLRIARSAGVCVQHLLGDPSMLPHVLAAVVAGDEDDRWAPPIEAQAKLNGHGG